MIIYSQMQMNSFISMTTDTLMKMSHTRVREYLETSFAFFGT